MNVTGLVKYVSKFGSGGSVFVGLKLDHPGKEENESIHMGGVDASNG